MHLRSYIFSSEYSFLLHSMLSISSHHFIFHFRILYIFGFYLLCCLLFKIYDISFSCTVPFINKAMELCGAEVPMVTPRKMLMCSKTSISASANTESISDQTVLSKREDLLIKSLFTLPSSNTHPPSLSATRRGKIKG